MPGLRHDGPGASRYQGSHCPAGRRDRGLTLDGIIDTLEKERRIELRNFGVFEVKQRKPRKARNPRTGESVMVPARFVVTFKPGLEMEERVGQIQKVSKEDQ